MIKVVCIKNVTNYDGDEVYFIKGKIYECEIYNNRLYAMGEDDDEHEYHNSEIDEYFLQIIEMKSKEIMANELIESLAFNCGDAKELVDIILSKEKEVYDIVNLYSIKGARWEEKELVDYVNEGWNEKVTLDEVLNMSCFYRLTSGLIVSWDY